MIFQQILNEEAGCLSYLIGCGQAGQAAVVDPARDRVDEYVALARRKGLTITHIVETHIHADHVSGNQALADKTGARIHIHPAAEAAFATTPIEDGEEIRLGNVALRVLHTPGHTPESVSLLVTDRARGDEPWFVLTGDTLFVGDVGRPDFGGERAAAVLYQSLTRRLLTLPDSVEVYPAHGAGPRCGRAMSSKTASTIGFERRFNLALREPTRGGLRAGAHDRAARRSRRTSIASSPGTARRPCRRWASRAPLTAAQAREAIDKGAVPLDVRTAAEYGEAHVPGAINVWIESPQFANRVGLFLPADVPFSSWRAAPPISPAPCRGWPGSASTRSPGICSGAWPTGRVRASRCRTVPQITVHDLATMREERRDLVILDVREPFEWDEGHIEGALHLPMAEAIRRRAEVPAGRPKAVLCAGGLRSSPVISALAREGVSGRGTTWPAA